MSMITHREFRTWQAWRKDQLNNPDRHDYYLMQIAGYIKYIMSNKSWNVKDFKIPFSSGEETQEIKKRKLEQSKRRWGVDTKEESIDGG